MSLAKVAVIVGAGPGIGISVAKKFAKEGYKIALVARSKDKLENYQKEVAGSHIFAGDAANEASLKAALDGVVSTLGNPEVVIYNAALVQGGKFDSYTTADFAASLQVNVVGAVATAKHFLKAQQEAKKGTILFTGGGLALGVFPGHYYTQLAVGKAAIRSLTQHLFEELKPQGIHVATVTVCGYVAPGTDYDPDVIALDYWKLHAEKPSEWTNEVIFKK